MRRTRLLLFLSVLAVLVLGLSAVAYAHTFKACAHHDFWVFRTHKTFVDYRYDYNVVAGGYVTKEHRHVNKFWHGNRYQGQRDSLCGYSGSYHD